LIAYDGGVSDQLGLTEGYRTIEQGWKLRL